MPFIYRNTQPRPRTACPCGCGTSIITGNKIVCQTVWQQVDRVTRLVIEHSASKKKRALAIEHVREFARQIQARREKDLSETTTGKSEPVGKPASVK
jgi:hypothetical protein